MATRTNDIRRYIDRAAAENGLRLRYGIAPAREGMPYLVYTLREINFDGAVSQYMMEVNGYLAGNEDAALDDMLDALETVFHMRHFVDGTMRVSTYRQGNRQDIQEPDRTIKRKRILFELRYSGGS